MCIFFCRQNTAYEVRISDWSSDVCSSDLDQMFASGYRIMFLRNERSLEVKNGTLGTIERVSDQGMAVRTDDGRSIAFDVKDYRDLDHGYAATIHKAQGMTVDRSHVLVTPGMDRHGDRKNTRLNSSH